MASGYRGAGDGQCIAIKNDGQRCTNGVWGSNHCCGLHQRVDDPRLAPEEDDRSWFHCSECGWQQAVFAGAGTAPTCDGCGVEFELGDEWDEYYDGGEA